MLKKKLRQIGYLNLMEKVVIHNRTERQVLYQSRIHLSGLYNFEEVSMHFNRVHYALRLNHEF